MRKIAVIILAFTVTSILFAEENQTELLSNDPDIAEKHWKDITKQEITEFIEDYDVNKRNEYGLTPLMFASWFNKDPEVIDILLDAGARVNVRDQFGFSPLLRAAANTEDPEIINSLLKAGADIDAQNEDGLSALSLAIINKRSLEVIDALLEGGADVNI